MIERESGVGEEGERASEREETKNWRARYAKRMQKTNHKRPIRTPASIGVVAKFAETHDTVDCMSIAVFPAVQAE